jgi:hypothetical protein
MAAGASAVVIILPVVRIERGLTQHRPEAPSGVKAKAARSVTKPAAKGIAKPAATGRKPRRKRATAALPSPACGRG